MIWKQITKEAVEKYKNTEVLILDSNDSMVMGTINIGKGGNPYGATEEFAFSNATHFLDTELLLNLPKEGFVHEIKGLQNDRNYR